MSSSGSTSWKKYFDGSDVKTTVKKSGSLLNAKTYSPIAPLSEGDEIQVRDKSKRFSIFQDSMRRIQGDNPAPWLTIDKSKLGTLDKTFFIELYFHLIILMQRVQRKKHSSGERKPTKNQYIFLSRR